MEFVTSNCHLFFSKNGELTSCNDVEGIVKELGCTHKPEEWRIFSDSSKFILKAVLLYNGNTHLSIPIVHSVHMQGNVREYGFALESYKLLEIWMEIMWRP